MRAGSQHDRHLATDELQQNAKLFLHCLESTNQMKDWNLMCQHTSVVIKHKYTHKHTHKSSQPKKKHWKKKAIKLCEVHQWQATSLSFFFQSTSFKCNKVAECPSGFFFKVFWVFHKNFLFFFTRLNHPCI